MALVECSHCGEKISESAKICPQCGYDFGKERYEKQAAKEFSRLPETEQRALRKEYNVVNPGLLQAENNMEKLKKILHTLAVLVFVGFMGWMIIVFLVRFVKLQGVLLTVLGISLILLGVASLIAFYVYSAKLKKQERLLLKEIKRFQLWLKDKKQMTYNIILTEKQKKIFNSI